MNTLIQNYSNHKKFKFTILIPLSSSLSYFEKCLESLLEQTHISPTEILLLDNCHHEIKHQDLEIVLQNYSHYLDASPYTFYYYRQPLHFGVYESINMGLLLANGEWIQILHDGDRLLPEAFYEFEQVIEKHPELDLISCRFYGINHQDEILEKSLKLADQGLVNSQFLQQFLATNPLSSAAVLYNKNSFSKIGYFDTNLEIGADWELLRRITKTPDLKWYYLPQHLVCQRLHETQQELEECNLAGEALWEILKLGETYYSPIEQISSKKSQYSRLFAIANGLLEKKKIPDLCAIMLDLVKFSNLGDRLWLEVLNQSDFSHKKELYNFVVQFSQKSYLS